MNSIAKISFIAIILFLTVSSCAKDETVNSSIPYAKVDIKINLILDNVFDNALQYKKYYPNKDGYAYVGYMGVVAISNAIPDNIYAYDLCCPYEAPRKVEIGIESAFKAKCPKCGSIFLLQNGGVAESGPAKESVETRRLKNYLVSKGDNYYRIFN